MSKLPISQQINLLGQPNEISKKWAVYTLQDAVSFEFVHVGHIRLTQLLTIADARDNPRVDFDRLYLMTVFSIEENGGTALRTAMMKIRELNLAILPKPRATPIHCLTTGETFQSAIEVVRAHGVTQSALSNHLNNKPGFNSVKGKVYKKLVPMDSYGASYAFEGGKIKVFDIENKTTTNFVADYGVY